MAPRPADNNLYPQEPKVEWFMNVASTLSNVNLGAGTAIPPSLNVHNSFQKLHQTEYVDYLRAHAEWRAECDKVDEGLHQLRLKRIFLETHREKPVPGFTLVRPDGSTSSVASYQKNVVLSETPGGVTIKGKFTVEPKVAPQPILSTKPHEAEKRANKKKLRDARTKRQALALEAKCEVIAADTVPVLKQRIVQVKELTDLEPLHKKEVAAAKSAVIRAKALSFGQLQAVNIDSSDWKVVTHKRVDKNLFRDIVDVKHLDKTGAHVSSIRISGIPSLVNGGRIAAAAAKSPQVVASK